VDTDPNGKYMDALLTSYGEEQAESLQERTKFLDPEVLVVSPLRRATQTGVIAFADHVRRGLKVSAMELCHEVAGKHTCDRRKCRSDLAQEFPEVDYSLVVDEDDPFWGDGLTRETDESLALRGADFMRWIRDRPERSIAVATHSQFLFTLFNTVLCVDKEQDRTWFGTGEMRTMRLEFHPTASPTPSS